MIVITTKWCVGLADFGRIHNSSVKQSLIHSVNTALSAKLLPICPIKRHLITSSGKFSFYTSACPPIDKLPGCHLFNESIAVMNITSKVPAGL